MMRRYPEFRPPVWYWRECQEEVAASWRPDAPPEPQIGQGWFDARSLCLHIWDGRVWVCVPRD